MKQMSLIAALALIAAACSPSKPADTATTGAGTAEAPAASSPTPSDPPPVTAANPVPNPAEDACNKSAYTAMIGAAETDPSIPPASPTVRHIHPGDQVTLDFRADRLNIDIDANGKITGLRCG
jgi:hypothetical protein